MSLIVRFDGNMNVIGRLLKEYRMKKGLSYEKLSANLELIGMAHVLGIDVNDLLVDIQKSFKN